MASDKTRVACPDYCTQCDMHDDVYGPGKGYGFPGFCSRRIFSKFKTMNY